MTWTVVLLAAFGAEPKYGSSTVLKIVFDLQIHDRADSAAGVGKPGKSGLVPTINDVSTFPIGSISRLILGNVRVFTVLALKRDQRDIDCISSLLLRAYSTGMVFLTHIDT
jgi:hypothetical protein